MRSQHWSIRQSRNATWLGLELRGDEARHPALFEPNALERRRVEGRAGKLAVLEHDVGQRHVPQLAPVNDTFDRRQPENSTRSILSSASMGLGHV